MELLVVVVAPAVPSCPPVLATLPPLPTGVVVPPVPVDALVDALLPPAPVCPPVWDVLAPVEAVPPFPLLPPPSSIDLPPPEAQPAQSTAARARGRHLGVGCVVMRALSVLLVMGRPDSWRYRQPGQRSSASVPPMRGPRSAM